MADFRIRVIIDPSGARRGGREVNRELRRIDNSAERTGRLLRRIFAFVGIAEAIRRLTRLSDTFTEMNNRVNIAGETIGDTTGVLEQLVVIANRTRTPVSQLVGLFQRGAIAAAELNTTHKELLQFVEAVGKGFAIQGGSAARNAFALLQLSQALGSSIVRGEEFNSILEGAFPIALAAARGIDRFGGSVARLRLAVVEGKVTSEEFFRGILNQADELDRVFQTTVPTIGQSFTILQNNLIEAVGAFNEATGTAQTLSMAIIGLSQNLDRLLTIIQAIAIAIISRYVTAAVLAGLATFKTSRDVVRLQIHLAGMGGTAAVAAAGMLALARTGAVLGGAMRFLGGPLGVVLLAAFAIFEFTRANREASRELETLPADIDAYRDSIISLTEAQVANRRLTLTDAIIEAQNELGALRQELERVELQIGLPESGLTFRLDRDQLQRDRIQILADIDTAQAEIERRLEQIRVGNERIQGLRRTDVPPPDTEPDDTSAIDKLRTAFERLQNRIDPVAAAQRDYASSSNLLTAATEAGIISLETRNRLLQSLAESYRDQIDPLQAVIASLDQEIQLAMLDEDERRIQIHLLETEQDLRKAGIRLSAEERGALEERIRTLDRLENVEEEITEGIFNRNALVAREIELLNRQAVISRQVGDERAASVARLNVEERIRQALREANRDLTEEQINNLARLSTVEAAAIDRAAELNYELNLQTEILDRIDGPARVFEERVKSLTALYNQGRITTAEFDRALRDLEITFLSTERGFVDGFERGLIQLQADFSDLATQSQDVLTRSFAGIEDRLVEFVSTGKAEFHSLVDSILSDLARIVIRQSILQPLAANLTAALADVFSPAAAAAPQGAGGNVTAGLIPRNASGGFIRGPGSARSDSILARLSNGEFVVNAGSTRKFLPLLSAINSAPGFQTGGAVGRAGAGRSFVTVNVIDQSASGNNIDVEQQSTPAGETINVLIRDATDSNIRSGRHDAALKGRFSGLTTPLVSR